MAEIARGLPPNQSGTVAFIDVIDVYLYRHKRRDTDGIRERGHIGHRGFDHQPFSRSEIIGADFPHGELIFQANYMRYRR